MHVLDVFPQLKQVLRCGSDGTLASEILYNSTLLEERSHLDPVRSTLAVEWGFDPFEAKISDQRRIYGDVTTATYKYYQDGQYRTRTSEWETYQNDLNCRHIRWCLSRNGGRKTHTAPHRMRSQNHFAIFASTDSPSVHLTDCLICRK